MDKETARNWMEFSVMFWRLLDNHQRDGYIQMIVEGLSPPPIEAEVEHWQRPLLLTHMGKVIRYYRIATGMEQKKLAEYLGRRASYISLIESGQKALSSLDTARVMAALKIPAHELFILPTPVKFDNAPEPPKVEIPEEIEIPE